MLVIFQSYHLNSMLLNHMLLLIFLFFWAEYSRELFLQASLRLLNLLYLLADHIFELYYLEVHIKNKLCLKWERILFYDILERLSLKTGPLIFFLCNQPKGLNFYKVFLNFRSRLLLSHGILFFFLVLCW